MKTKITFFLLITLPIYAQVEPVKIQKQWIFSLSKIGSSIVPYEKEQFTDIFGPYKTDPRRNINSYEFFAQKKFEDTKFAFYFDFFELIKRDYSLKYLDFQNRSILLKKLQLLLEIISDRKLDWDSLTLSLIT